MAAPTSETITTGPPRYTTIGDSTGYGGAEGQAAHPDAVEICHLQVRPEHRGKGVGTALIVASERRASERGHRRIAVGVADDNPEARRLYERLGYRPTGIVDISDYLYEGWTLVTPSRTRDAGGQPPAPLCRRW